MCSFDARSKGQPRPLPLKKGYKESEAFAAALLNGLFEHPAEKLLWPAKPVKREA